VNTNLLMRLNSEVLREISPLVGVEYTF